MADYKRQVSYMYLYEEGKKRNNTGYARVETRNGQCKYTIHVTALGLNDKQLKVYSFKRTPSGMEGILLGALLIKNNTGDFKVVTDAAHIMNSPYGIEDLGGILLVFSDRKFFAAEWDGKPITMPMIAGIDRKANESKAEEKRAEGRRDEDRNPDSSPKDSRNEGIEAVDKKSAVRNEENRKTEGNNTPEEIKAATLAEVLFEYSKTPAAEAVKKEPLRDTTGDILLKDLLTPNINLKNPDNHRNHGSAENLITNPSKTTEKSAAKDFESPIEDLMENFAAEPGKELVQNPVTDPAQSLPEAAVNPVESLDGYPPKTDVDAKDSSLPENTAAGQPKEQEAPSGEATNTEGLANTKPVFDDHPLAKQIYHNFPKMYPFEDNEIAWCARIEPKDIGMLPMDLWGLGNNSFLLHGYYSYRHLIFARANDKNGQNYILGVPGIYHNREKFMAKMFGFENFKCAKRKPQRTGEFGYWYVPVLLNRDI